MKFSDFNKKKKVSGPPPEEKTAPPKAAPPKAAPPTPPPAQERPAPAGTQEPRPKSLFLSPLATRPKQPEEPQQTRPQIPQQAQVGKPGRPDELKTATRLQTRSANDCYGALISAIKRAAAEAQDGASVRDHGVGRPVAACQALLETQPFPLLCLTSRSTAGNYLYAHSANVCILSTHLALGLGWPKDQVLQLGVEALLHELKLSRLLDISIETGSPTAEEERETRLHPTDPAGLRKHLANIEATIRDTDDFVPDPKFSSHIVGVCCLYEAMSHFRAWRENLLPHDAVRGIIKTYAEVFDRAAKHLFLGRLTLYPPGSYVQLSRGEIASVLAVDARTPTLPTVSVRLSADGVLLDPPQEVELATNSLVHIERPVDETKLTLKDKKILMAFEAERWWVG